MSRCILLLFLVFTSFSLYSQESDYDKMLKEHYKGTVPTIRPAELYSKMMKGETVHLLDTRLKKEYEVSALKGAVNIGFLFYDKASLENHKKDETIIVYCTIGARSETVGEKIKSEGYTNVYNLYGGIIQWVNEGYPVYNQKNKPTEKVHVYSKDWGKWLKKGTAVY